ncbi:MAG: hypothetical protein H6636_04980 [Anaerolineales bacterium]|nr:hypothetical protein [Anaerolineales bacterium]
MKKIFALGLVFGAVLALAALGFGVYSATSAKAASANEASFNTSLASQTPFLNRLELFQIDDTNGDHPLQPYIDAAIAKILGLTVDELQTAKTEGKQMSDLLDAAGLTQEEFQAAFDAAAPGIVEQALADGVITQEQADAIVANGLRMFNRGGPGGHDGFGGPGSPHGHGDFGVFGIPRDSLLQPYVETAAANILGMSVEDFQAAKDAGTRVPDLLDQAGLTADEFQTAMEEALPGIVEQALKDEVITQAQADYLLENGLRGAKGYLRSALQEYIDATVADILGVSVEDLQAARDAGTVSDLLDAAGLTGDDLRTALETATPEIIAQALKDGVITQAQADYLLENGLPFHMHDGPGGKGGHGPGGHGDFGGSGGSDSGQQTTPTSPATDANSGNG